MSRKNLVLLAMSFAIVLVANTSCVRGNVRVNLAKNKVSKIGDLVTVGDVAEVSSTESRISHKISALDLAEFELGKREIEISKNQVRMRLIVAGFSPDDFLLSGHNRILVRKSEIRNAQTLIENRVLDEMNAQFSIDKNNINLTMVSPTQNKTIVDLVKYLDQATVVFPADLPTGKANCRFLFVNGEGSPATLELSFQFHIQHEVVVATRPIRRGSHITADSVKKIRRPLQNSRFVSLQYEECVGMSATKDIAAHSIIKASQVEPANKPVRLRRNDRVDVISRQLGSQFRVPNAKVLNNASKGEMVSVANPLTNKVIRAVVIDSSTVELK